jgi:uncharacterized RDD family membrane protein YckC
MSQESNPFQAPASVVEPIDPTYRLEPASKARRFGTLVVDYFAYLALSFLVGGILGALFGPAGVKAIQATPNLVFGCIVLFAYYMFFEGIWQRTPGKWLFGTVVVNETGGKPSLGQIAGRTASRLIPFEAFSFFGARGWHDRIPKTLVVRARRAP